MSKVYIEYGKEAELISKNDNGYVVRIVGKDEVTDKTIGYKPLPVDGWKYEDGTLIEKDGVYSTIKRYTTYLRSGVLVFSYKKSGVKRYSDDLLYEPEIYQSYTVVIESPFLSPGKISELQDELHEKLAPIKEEIRDLSNKIKTLEKEILETEKSYQIDDKCQHDWEKNGEEKYDDGKSTKKFYVCSVCGKEDTQHWHKLF